MKPGSTVVCKYDYAGVAATIPDLWVKCNHWPKMNEELIVDRITKGMSLDWRMGVTSIALVNVKAVNLLNGLEILFDARNFVEVEPPLDMEALMKDCATAPVKVLTA